MYDKGLNKEKIRENKKSFNEGLNIFDKSVF